MSELVREATFDARVSNEADGTGDRTLAGRRERKKLATRKQLRAAALELVAARGLSEVTVEDIAELADVSTRTFFNYFPTKEAAVVSIEVAERDRLQQELLELAPELSPLEALRSVILHRIERLVDEVDELGEDRATWLRRYQACKADPDLHLAWVGQMYELERMLSETLAMRMQRSPDDPYTALLTSTVLAAMRIAAIRWTALDGEASYVEIAAAAIDTLASGLKDTDRISNVLCKEQHRTKQRRARQQIASTRQNNDETNTMTKDTKQKAGSR